MKILELKVGVELPDEVADDPCTAILHTIAYDHRIPLPELREIFAHHLEEGAARARAGALDPIDEHPTHEHVDA